MTRRFHILITAGPTREYLDPVRYLSNDSSGRMGFALARSAANMGLRVTLVAGPVSLATPPGVKRIDVVSARQMRAAVLAHAPRADLVIMCAAVADWRPARYVERKIKRINVPAYQRTSVRRDDRVITLVENPDILAELGMKKKPHQTLVGFALETNDLERNARHKLVKKNCDWIVANSAASIGRESSRAVLIARDGRRIPLPRLPKEALAVVILSHVLG